MTTDSSPHSRPERELLFLVREAREAQHLADLCSRRIREYHKRRSQTHPEQYVTVKIGWPQR